MEFLSGICLITANVRNLAEFYQSILNVKTEINDIHVDFPLAGGGIVIYSKSEAENCMGFDFSKYHGTGMCKFTLLVDNIDSEYERLKSLEVEIITPPTNYPWGARSMHFRDLDGNIVCFLNRIK